MSKIVHDMKFRNIVTDSSKNIGARGFKRRN